MRIKVIKNALEKAFCNPVIRFLGAMLFICILLWLSLIGYEYATFCALIHENSQAVLKTPNAIVVSSLDGYAIEFYTRVCMDFGMRVIDNTTAATPVSVHELANMLYMPVLVYGLANVVSIIVIYLSSSHRLKCWEAIVAFVIIYTFELGMIYSTYGLMYSVTTNTLVSSFKPFLMGLLGYKNFIIFTRLVK